MPNEIVSKMGFHSCNRFRFIVFILLILIVWQVIRLLPYQKEDETVSNLSIEKLEDGQYNIHKIDKIKVRVYYETLCPDSKYFFIKQLAPTVDKLIEFLDVVLVPYGKATTTEQDGEYYFKCQHGEEECYGNKIHSCAINYITNQKLSVDLASCMIADNFDADGALSRCSKSLNIDAKNITKCAQSEEGSVLLKLHGDDTHAVKPVFIPTILLNGSKENQAGILKNFLLAVCKLIDMPLPPPCL